MRTLFLATLMVCLGARAVDTDCGGGVKTHDPAARIYLSAGRIQTSDPLWKKHLMMLEAMNLIPNDIELAFTPGAIHQGKFQTIHFFQNALNKVMLTPQGNVSLRMLAHLCQVIATDVGVPRLAGDLFLSYVNQLPFDIEGLVSGEAPNALEIVRRIKQQSLLPFIPLSSMQEASDAEMILSSTFAGLNNLSFYMQPSSEANSSFINALYAGISSLGFQLDSGNAVTVGDESTLVFVGGRARFDLKWKALQEDQAGPLIIAPAIGSTLTELAIPWNRIAFWNGTQIGGVLTLRMQTARRLQRDLHIFERLMLPLLVRSGAFELIQMGIEVAGGEVEETALKKENWQRYSVFTDTVKLPADATAPQLYQAAVAQFLHSTISRVPDEESAQAFQSSAAELLLHDAHRGLTYADMELASRAYDLPIEIIAAKMERPGLKPGRPWIPNEATPPNYIAYVIISHPHETQRLKTLWGLDAASNLTLLRTDTGIFVIQR